MANKIVIPTSLIRKLPPLAVLDEEYLVYADDSEAVSKSIPEVDKEKKLSCKRKAPSSLSLNRTKKNPCMLLKPMWMTATYLRLLACSDKELQQLPEWLKPAKTEACKYSVGHKNFMKCMGLKSKIAVPDDPGLFQTIFWTYDPANVSKYLHVHVCSSNEKRNRW